MASTVHDFRPRAAGWLAATGAVALVPSAFIDIGTGQALVGVGELALACLLAIGTWLTVTGRYSPTAVVLLFGAPAIALNTFAFTRFDMSVAFWAFVVVMAFYLVLPLRWALVLTTMMFALSVPVTSWQYGFAVGGRFAVCLAMIGVFGAVTVHLIDDRQRLLVERMTTDPLTGVLNRSTLVEVLAAAAADTDNAAGASLLALDIDHFKTINDRFGHAAGDEVLVGFAALTRDVLRVGTPVFRIGGEEFLVLIEGMDRGRAVAVAERLIDAVANHAFLPDHRITVSIGVAERVVGEGASSWLRRADEALYRAKFGGRNRLDVA